MPIPMYFSKHHHGQLHCSQHNGLAWLNILITEGLNVSNAFKAFLAICDIQYIMNWPDYGSASNAYTYVFQ